MFIVCFLYNTLSQRTCSADEDNYEIITIVFGVCSGVQPYHHLKKCGIRQFGIPVKYGFLHSNMINTTWLLYKIFKTFRVYTGS